MFEYLESLGDSEKANLKKTIGDLFRQTCILQVKYNPVTLEARDNPRYDVCVKHKDFIEDYLDVLGCELLHDPQEHIFVLGGEGVVTERLGIIATKVLILLKLIYKDKIMGAGLGATTTTLAEIRKYGTDTGLIISKLTAAQWGDVLSLFKRHQLIDLPCAISNLVDDAPIYMYSTINVLFPTSKINELVEELKNENDEQINIDVE